MLNSLGILSIGSELLDGRVLDTNSKWLAKELHGLGITVISTLTVGDNITEITQALDFLVKKNVAGIIISGGLGPTTDDLTRSAVASFLKVELVLDAEILEEIKALFNRRGRVFSPSNALQAERPKGSRVIRNPVGTAPGFIANFSNKNGANCNIYSLPGIPSELQAMFNETVKRDLISQGLGVKQAELVFRIFGISESALNEEIKKLNLPDNIETIYSVSFPTITLIFRSLDSGLLATLENKISEAIGVEYIFSRKLDANLADSLLMLLSNNGKTVVTAESCTGGLIGSLLTKIPGSSKAYLGGVISYSNQLKSMLLGVSSHDLEKHGAVSKEVATQMAIGAREKFNADYAMSVTGIAGPDGGSPEKPVGTVFIGVSSRAETKVTEHHFVYDRDRVQTLSAYTAINNLRLFIKEN